MTWGKCTTLDPTIDLHPEKSEKERNNPLRKQTENSSSWWWWEFFFLFMLVLNEQFVHGTDTRIHCTSLEVLELHDDSRNGKLSFFFPDSQRFVGCRFQTIARNWNNYSNSLVMKYGVTWHMWHSYLGAWIQTNRLPTLSSKFTVFDLYFLRLVFISLFSSLFLLSSLAFFARSFCSVCMFEYCEKWMWVCLAESAMPPIY